MVIETLPMEFSVCKVPQGSQVDLGQPYVFVGRTPQELSVVCPLDAAPDPEAALEREDGWRAFRIAGQLDFGLVGILAEVSRIIAAQKIGIFAVSTYDTDYVLTKTADFDRALAALVAAGHEVVALA